MVEHRYDSNYEPVQPARGDHRTEGLQDIAIELNRARALVSSLERQYMAREMQEAQGRVIPRPGYLDRIQLNPDENEVLGED